MRDGAHIFKLKLYFTFKIKGDKIILTHSRILNFGGQLCHRPPGAGYTLPNKLASRIVSSSAGALAP